MVIHFVEPSPDGTAKTNVFIQQKDDFNQNYFQMMQYHVNVEKALQYFIKQIMHCKIYLIK